MLTFLEIFKMLNIPNKRPPSFVLYNHSVCVLYETNHFGAKCEANAKITLRSHQPQLVSRNFSFGEGRTFKNGMKMKLRRPPYPCTLSQLNLLNHNLSMNGKPITNSRPHSFFSSTLHTVLSALQIIAFCYRWFRLICQADNTLGI